MEQNETVDEYLVSVIIPVYNQEQYIDSCLNSIISITDDRYQIIAVDDGSKDNSLEILNKYCGKVLVLHQQNQGVSSARNKGLLYAKGKWIAFIDPDDQICPHYFSALLNNVDDETDISICSYYSKTGDNLKREFFFKEDFCAISPSDKRKLFLQLLNASYGDRDGFSSAIGVPWARLYRREFLCKYNLKFNIKLRRLQDNAFNMWSFYYARKVFYANNPQYIYNLENITGYKNSKYRPIAIENFEALYDEREAFFIKDGEFLDAEIEKYYSKAIIDDIYDVIHDQIVHNDNTSKLSVKIKQLSCIISNPHATKILFNKAVKFDRRTNIKKSILKIRPIFLVFVLCKLYYKFT